MFFLYPTPFNSDNTTLEDVDENTYIVPSHKNTPQRRLMTLRLVFKFPNGGYQITTIRRIRIDHMIQNHGLISGQQRSLLHLLCRFHQLREQNNWDFWWRLLQEHPLVPNHKVLECIIWRILHSIYYEMKIEDDSTVYVRAICTNEPITFLRHQGDCGFFPFVHFLVSFPNPTDVLNDTAEERVGPFFEVEPDIEYKQSLVMSAGPLDNEPDIYME